MPGDVVHWGERGGDLAPVVCAVGAVNALATSSHQTWAFRRAELTAVAETPFVLENGTRASMAHVRTLPPRAFGADRMAPLAARAFAPVAAALAGFPGDGRLAVALCLPERLAEGAPPHFAGQRYRLVDALTAMVRAAGVDPVVRVVPRGHAAGAFAAIECGEALRARKVDAAVILGVDTWYDPDVVEALIDAGAIFDGENLDAFIPGEGAACALVAPRDVARRAGWDARAVLESAATDYEPAHAGTDLPCHGAGLSRPLRAIADRVQRERRAIDWWLGDVTTEDDRVHEVSLALPRASAGASAADPRLDFLPPLLGDLGAATIPTGIAIAVEGMSRGDPDAATCLLYGASRGGDRGAVLVGREAPRRGG